jgi:hypothetical protein
VLTSYFGNHYEFSFTAPTGVTREFDSFWDAAREAGASRIYGGIHFNFANRDGLALGENVAEWALDTFEESHEAVAADRIPWTGDSGLLGIASAAENLWA